MGEKILIGWAAIGIFLFIDSLGTFAWIRMLMGVYN